VGWSDPEGSRHRLGSLLLGYYTQDDKLIYAGRAGTGMADAELERLWHRLQPLAAPKMPLAVPPPRGSRFGSPLVLSRVHWVRPEWWSRSASPNGRLTVCSGMSFYLDEREDKLAIDVRRDPAKSGNQNEQR
jgi:ATP-dependent DNA ligase